MLIEAFARVAGRHPDASLVFTGAPGSADAEVRAAAEASGIGPRITFTGRIPAADLATLMAGATVMAYPSRYEGFGIPVLEAMAAGVPAVVAAGTAAADLATSAGVVLEPDDVAGWAEELDLLMADSGYRSQVAPVGPWCGPPTTRGRPRHGSWRGPGAWRWRCPPPAPEPAGAA